MMRNEEIGGVISSTLTSSSTTSSRCQDCGNQAKKDCLHQRCRTCCKGRGFHCQTHLKSTWIPVSRRRPTNLTMHHHHQISPSHVPHQHLQYGPNPSRENPALGFQEGIFPSETSFPAVFRCVRVSSMDNVVDQYAYQTSVNIGGHVFTGILYHQGPEPEGTVNYVTGESSASILQEHNFVTRTTATDGNTSPHFLPFTIGSSQFFH